MNVDNFFLILGLQSLTLTKPKKPGKKIKGVIRMIFHSNNTT
jgi:hypothetical protein